MFNFNHFEGNLVAKLFWILSNKNNAILSHNKRNLRQQNMFCKSQVLMQFGSKVDSGRPTPELCVTKPTSRRIIKFSRDCILHQEYRVLWCVQVYLVLYWPVVGIFLMHRIWLSIVFCQTLQHQLVEDSKTISGLNPTQPPFYKQKWLLD